MVGGSCGHHENNYEFIMVIIMNIMVIIMKR